jgi:signal transduction histidine kinase
VNSRNAAVVLVKGPPGASARGRDAPTVRVVREPGPYSAEENGVWAIPPVRWQKAASFAVHDAKNGLCALMGTIEWLRSVCSEEFPNEEVLESIDEMKGYCRRLSSLLSETLAAARGDEVEHAPSPFDLESLVALTVAAAQQRATLNRNVRLQSVNEGKVVALFDSSLFRRVLDALVDSGVHHSPADQEVVVEYRVWDDRVEVSVWDQGALEERAKLESPVEVLAEEALWKEVSGIHTGLGLSFCRAFARAHGGELRVDPGLGGGTKVTLSLPLVGPDSGRATRGHQESASKG